MGSLAVYGEEDVTCTYAILDDEVTMIEDVSDDPRFDRDTAVCDVGFYAGAPVTTDDGQAIGSFCLTATEPRSFSAADVDHLRRFADEAMDQLELRRRLADTEAVRA